MHIELGISYYDFDQNAALKDDDPLCIIELDPTLTWTDIGSVVIIDSEPLWAEGTGLKNAIQSVNQGRLGVMITLADKGGKIGRFNYVYFLNVLVNAVVMMGVADVIASLIAKFGLGKKSQMYNAAINERLSFSSELARFSAQALVAKNCFNAIDTDGDGTISQKELAEELKDVLNNEMDDEGVAAAARAVFRVLDHGASSEEQVGEDSTISLFELIETMQNDRLTWADLKFVMQEYAKLEQKLRHSQSQNSVSRTG
ncbi:unnamed protein product [Polarella glacialis]|uniref:EF-hand domain-containing protein n=1 Tax=Polarella glacialis TaxID=89957 RepID=A0A813DU30_POLGL|nr:unnamed protein product [Polarella glacialis]